MLGKRRKWPWYTFFIHTDFALNNRSHHKPCLALLARLKRIRGFNQYLELCARPTPVGHFSQRRAADVQQLWDTFCLGTPLCYLYNLLPGEQDIYIKTGDDSFGPSDVGAKQAAMKMFVGALGSLAATMRWSGDLFKSSDLLDEDPTDSKRVLKVRVLTLLKLCQLRRSAGRSHHKPSRRQASPKRLCPTHP